MGRKITDANIFFHHAHNIFEAEKFKELFPETKLITTIRDPRSAIVSTNEYGKNTDLVEFDNYRNFYLSLCMPIFEDPQQNSFFRKVPQQKIAYGAKKNKALLERIDKNSLLVRLEDIPKESFLRALSSYLKISYMPVLEVSTWGGMEWWGDTFSSKKISPRGWKENRTYNGWSDLLSQKDQFLLEICLNDLMKNRLYQVRKINYFKVFQAFFLILLP